MKIISMALFALDEARHSVANSGRCWYYGYLPAVVRAHLSCFPGWQLWIYHDASIYSHPYGEVLLRLHIAGHIRLIYAGEASRVCEAMLWRFRPCWEPDVQCVAPRDVDALPMPRDFRALEKFSASGKRLMTIHDSVSHCGIMGGLSAFNVEAFRRTVTAATWEDWIKACTVDLAKQGGDQHYLARTFGEADIIHRFPPRDDVRDCIGSHLGGACDVTPILAWYDAINAPTTQIVRAAEAHHTFALAPKHRVVFGVDQHPQYLGVMPITALMWMLSGYRPLILLEGPFAEWTQRPAARWALDTARLLGAELLSVGRVAGHRPATTIQVGRVFAAAHYLVKPNDYLLTSDADMWPLSRDYFLTTRKTDKRVQLYYANAYGHAKYPLCYVGALAETWREIVGIRDGRNIRDHVQACLDDGLGKDEDSWAAWNFDEEWFGKRIKAWKGYEADCQMIDRHGGPPKDRIDRSAWPEKPNAAGMVDAHLLRPVEAHWMKMRPLVEQIAPEWLSWADDYVSGFASRL